MHAKKTIIEISKTINIVPNIISNKFMLLPLSSGVSGSCVEEEGTEEAEEDGIEEAEEEGKEESEEEGTEEGENEGTDWRDDV